MSTQKAKFALYSKLQDLGFTYEEAFALRRIELTLQSWAVRECGDGSDWAIERDEKTGKPYNTYHGQGRARRYAIADREAGALRRLAAIVAARNARGNGHDINMTPYAPNHPAFVLAYHQGDCRGCMLYLLTREQLGADAIDSVYTRGLAVCA